MLANRAKLGRLQDKFAQTYQPCVHELACLVALSLLIGRWNLGKDETHVLFQPDNQIN